MKKIGMLFLAAGMLALVVWFFLTNPGAWSKVYLWLIGLFGILTWPLRKLWNWLNGGQELKEIEQNNQYLRQQLEQIKAELARARSKLQAERQMNARLIKDLQGRIARQDQQGREIERQLTVLKNQPLEAFKESLPAEEKKSFERDIWKEVDFGL